MPNRSKSLMPAPRFNYVAWLPAVVAATLSLALYAVTLGGTYIFDDRAIILEDPRIADSHHWPNYLTEQYLPGAPDNLYRPLVSLSYAIQWRLHGDRAWAFHLVNWLLAAGTAAAAAEIARRLVVQSASEETLRGAQGDGFMPSIAIAAVPGGTSPRPEQIKTDYDGAAPFPSPGTDLKMKLTAMDRGEGLGPLVVSPTPACRGMIAGAIAGLLFAAHPVHVEAVAGIVGRAELVCTLATFAGLCLFLYRPLTGPRAAAIVACFLVALLSKEQGILFPLLLGVLAFFRTPRAALSARERTCNKWMAVSLIWLESAYLLFREHVLKFEWNRQWLSWPANPLVHSAGPDRWLMPLVLLGRYVVLLFAPYKLSLDYGSSVIGSSVRYHEPYFFLGIAATLGWLAALIALVRAGACRASRPSRAEGTLFTTRKMQDIPLAGAAAFALIGLALTLGMVSNLLSLIGTIFGERLAYMPSAFLSLLAGVVAAKAWNRVGRRRGIAASVCVLVALGSMRTVSYAKQWNDRLAFYKRAVAEQPKSVRLHALLYHEYVLAGDWQAARAVGEHCRQEVPLWWESWAMCFEPDIHLGRLPDAMDLIRRAEQLCPNDALIDWDGLVRKKLGERQGLEVRGEGLGVRG